MLNTFSVILATMYLCGTNAFMLLPSKVTSAHGHYRYNLSLSTSTEEKAAQEVNGEDLELMLTEWDTPLVVDAYATW